MGEEPVVPVELVPEGAASTTRVRSGRRLTLLVVVAVVVVGGLAAAVLLAGDGRADPDDTLAAAQAATAEATSFRFAMSSESVMSLGDERNGTETRSGKGTRTSR